MGEKGLQVRQLRDLTHKDSITQFFIILFNAVVFKAISLIVMISMKSIIEITMHLSQIHH